MGLLLICLAAITWGTTGTISVLISQQVTVSPLIVSLWRIVFGLPIFWLWHRQNTRRQLQRTSIYWPPKVCRLPLIAMGLCMAGYQVFYFAAVPYVGVAMTAMVSVCSSPLIIALLAIAFLGEKLTRGLCIALTLGVTGTVLLIAQPEALQIDGSQFLLGVALAFGAAFSYSGYAVLAKSLVVRMDAIAIATYSFTAAALVLTPTLVIHPTLDIWLKALPFSLYLGLITCGIAYSIYMLGIRHTPATVAGIAVLLEPLTAALLGIFAFKEPISWSGALGALLLIVGILYARKGDTTN
ncbi:DMT family transporter [Leptothoe spongobia]|uniref:DMT family transporter n=1 Tax=Leptothoe spongobia TAU-MAC 1115 TaxID=1967444 RepID=A0A947GIU7_9CYAN|nr:DMT family transporter [Leptothoe spongobia]MBT9315969.1 DMT family transporter [Leptothoe spongobia TAU-MAC 1115]